MGRIILRTKLMPYELEMYDVDLVHAIENPYTEMTEYIYKGDRLPKWEPGDTPESYYSMKEYLGNVYYAPQSTS